MSMVFGALLARASRRRDASDILSMVSGALLARASRRRDASDILSRVFDVLLYARRASYLKDLYRAFYTTP